jgi:cytochrome b subunit of formate dehydrogenase
MYSTSVHGKLMKTGSKKAPNCTSCHGIHNIKNRVQPNSTISSINVPETCSKCHKEIAEEYKKSIHWIGVMKGISSSPSCNDCHSEHAIQAINSTDNLNMKKEIQEKTCLVCHESILLSERYGINEANASKYCDSYHGLAAKGGLVNAAMCIDCHGVHKILPAYSEESDINPKNLTKTCQKCHEEATDVFAKSYSHISKKENSAKYIEDIVRTIYLWLIIIVIGGMMIHNIIIFIHDLKEKRIHEKNQIRIPRFTKNELIQHTFLLVSFIMLSFSGFLLKFPGTWWADILYNIGIDEASRKVVHRVSAVVMIVLSLYHVIYLIATERGRSVLNGLFPRMHDIKAAIDNIKYYLRITNKHPEFENYNYAEKAEYWALIWGTIVMVFTGFVLWFPTNIGNWAPVWLIKVSEIIHYYEAILATLAIVVWHWFFVIFRPKEYPVNFVVADGQMTVEHYKHEHELRFKKVIMEWIDVKNGSKPENKTSHFTKLFISALEKNNVNVEEFFNSEIDKYEDLKEYVYKHSSKI